MTSNEGPRLQAAVTSDGGFFVSSLPSPAHISFVAAAVIAALVFTGRKPVYRYQLLDAKSVQRRIPFRVCVEVRLSTRCNHAKPSINRRVAKGGEAALRAACRKLHRPFPVSHSIKSRLALVAGVFAASRSHRTPETDAIIAQYPGAELVSVGSSLKFCLIAAGEADLYPRLAPTMQWDTAAGDAVLRNAGGVTRRTDGAVLTYGPRGGDKPWLNPWFIAEGRRGQP